MAEGGGGRMRHDHRTQLLLVELKQRHFNETRAENKIIITEIKLTDSVGLETFVGFV